MNNYTFEYSTGNNLYQVYFNDLLQANFLFPDKIINNVWYNNKIQYLIVLTEQEFELLNEKTKENR